VSVLDWDLATVAAAAGGTAVGSARIGSVAIDSRTAPEGSLFVALHGEHHDGHDFAAAAHRSGATAVLVERGRAPEGVPAVEVDDTLEALRVLGAHRRSELDLPFVAVTGSTGKTSTKDLIAAALGDGAHAATRSFNNEIGVPLTVLSCPASATAAVVEVGSRGRGDIAHLAAVVRPDVAVITGIGRAHLETFGDEAGVLAAKWELVEALGTGGVAVLPADDDRLAGRTDRAVITFGDAPGADVAARDVSLDALGRASFTLGHGSEHASLVMVSAGRHQARNAAAAVAAALALGIPFGDAAGRVSAATTSPWRMEVSTLAVGDGTATVVNDAYNANPDSMAAAFQTVVEMGRGPRIAVLGKMHELGAAEAEAHREVGRLAAAAGFDPVVVVGDDPGIASGAGDAALAVSDLAGAVQAVRDALEPGAVVLVKASRAEGLERVAAGLADTAAHRTTDEVRS
jgi:UDP-N-acetylmuramoyl-tripeptide--D-alanyl-D-alanine ligase